MPAVMPSILMKGFAALVLGCAALTASAGTYTASLSGAKEATPNDSPGTGNATVVFDIGSHSLTIDITFAGLTAGTSASHIHCCTAVPDTGTAGVATQTPTFTGFPLGVTSGTYHHVFDTSLAESWNAAVISSHGGTTAGAESALLAGLDAGTAYLNIHTTAFPGGEIRGFLMPVPEPAAVALFALGAPLVLTVARRRNHKLG